MAEKKRILIITHCYAGRLPQYAAFLRLQLESVMRWGDDRTTVCVCYTESDLLTVAVIRAAMNDSRSDGRIVHQPLEPGELFKRCIGRNRVTLASNHEVIWYCDVDYFFGEGCLQAARDAVEPGDGLVFPKRTMIHKDHETGDALAGLLMNGSVCPWPSADEFVVKREKVAIGGLQIIGGDKARSIGYLGDDAAWMEPASVGKGFRRCRCDTVWRRRNGFPKKKIDVPNLYRCRHTENGRNVKAAESEASQ